MGNKRELASHHKMWTGWIIASADIQKFYRSEAAGEALVGGGGGEAKGMHWIQAASLTFIGHRFRCSSCLFVFVCLFVCLEQEEVSFAWTVLCSPHPATPMACGGTGYIFYLSEKVKKLMLKPYVKRFMKINVILSPS